MGARSRDRARESTSDDCDEMYETRHSTLKIFTFQAPYKALNVNVHHFSSNVGACVCTPIERLRVCPLFAGYRTRFAVPRGLPYSCADAADPAGGSAAGVGVHSWCGVRTGSAPCGLAPLLSKWRVTGRAAPMTMSSTAA